MIIKFKWVTYSYIKSESLKRIRRENKIIFQDNEKKKYLLQFVYCRACLDFLFEKQDFNGLLKGIGLPKSLYKIFIIYLFLSLPKKSKYCFIFKLCFSNSNT